MKPKSTGYYIILCEPKASWVKSDFGKQLYRLSVCLEGYNFYGIGT